MDMSKPISHTNHPTTLGSFELWVKVVKEIVGVPTEGLSLLDLCCNECTVTSHLKCDHHVGVDVVDWPTRQPVHTFLKQDVLLALKREPEQAFDLAICSDGIEHLTKLQGVKLLKEMERVASLSIVFTPLGDYMVEPDSNHPDKHRSGWRPEELEALGWNTSTYPNWHPSLGVGAFFAWKGSI